MSVSKCSTLAYFLFTAIQLVNCVNEVEISIQNLTQCYLPEGTKLAGAASKCFKAGINFDPRTNGLVMNGKPGHLQCYSFRDDKHLFSVSINCNLTYFLFR